MCTRARRFFAKFNRFEVSAPLVEASSGHPELLGQLIDAFTALHPLYGHALKLPGISLSSLHCCFLSRRVCPSRVCQFKGSFQDLGPTWDQNPRLYGLIFVLSSAGASLSGRWESNPRPTGVQNSLFKAVFLG